MFTILIKFIFKIIGWIGNIILLPIFALINSFMPQKFGGGLDAITNAWSYIISKFVFLCKFLMIPSQIFTGFFGFVSMLLAGFLAIRCY